nr:STAS domain-containing protein [Kineococcus siccus]
MQDAERVRVVLAGEIDAACETDLRAAADRVLAAGLPVVVDVSRVGFMDSTGAAFLARVAARLQPPLGPRSVTVVGASAQVAFLLEVTLLDTYVVLEDPR